MGKKARLHPLALCATSTHPHQTEKTMIKNLPATFPLAALERFSFGGPDGKDDPLLEQCSLRIRPIIEFLDENKSIVVGERGTGKTALFRLIAEETLQFVNHDKRTQICIPIDEELAYRTLREHVSKQIQDQTGKPSIAYRIVWELLFVSRCLDRLEKKYGGDADLKSIRSKFIKVVGWQSDESIGFLDILTRTKKTFGVKLEAGHTGYVVPNFYASIEPSKNVEQENSNNLLTLDLVDIKASVNAFLKKKKAFVYILLDKLDEFVAGEDYLTQTEMLQALIQCWRDYQTYPAIKIKLFLRKDLYERIDFSSIGRDKVDARRVDLQWTDEDIRQFIALRLYHNLQTTGVIGKRGISFSLDEGTLMIDRKFLKELRSLDSIPDQELGLADRTRKAILRIKNYLDTRNRDRYDARTTNIKDAVFQSLITLCFPRNVYHVTRAGKKEQINIFDYLGTHFQLGSGHTTPRVILMFLQQCLENTRNYYRDNPDYSVALNERGEYALFLRDSIQDAYGDLRRSCLTTMVGLNRNWEKGARALMQNRSTQNKCDEVCFRDAIKVVSKHFPPDVKTEDELIRFFAFYEHAGLFGCKNRNVPSELRSYSIPILFRKVSL